MRPAPWLAFNAETLPSPQADSAPTYGPNRFLLGANLPWIRYGLDFGTSAATPMGGLHADAAALATLDATLGRLRRDGVEQVRVFLFCDGRAGIRFLPDGTPQGLDDAVWKDVDALLASAERHRVGLLLVLFDAALVAAPTVQGGAVCGGHADVLADAAKREALLEQVVEPLLKRYAGHAAIDGWDVFDEPECATVGMRCPHPALPWRARQLRQLRGMLASGLRALGLAGTPAPAAALVEASAMRSYLQAAVHAVHQHSRALATVGLASTANFSLVQGLGLDFYQAHWWEMYGDAALRRAAADFQLDRPLILGAFPACTATKSVKTVLDTARCAGYGGALVWSARSVDGRGGEDGQLAQWVRNHVHHLHRRPVRMEVKVDPPPLASVPAVVDEAAPKLQPAEDDEPSSRRETDEVPGLAAAPA